MKALAFWTLTLVIAITGILQAQSSAKSAAADSDKDKLIGAWRLVSMEEAGPGGKLNHVIDRRGILIYTRDGHMSVQIMFPKSESTRSNDYVQDGYEASFGSYDLNEETHIITHHVQGSVTRGLVGKDLPRIYQFSHQHLIIKSSRPDEHWSVTWEHY